jgi:hypothetical protein
MARVLVMPGMRPAAVIRVIAGLASGTAARAWTAVTGGPLFGIAATFMASRRRMLAVMVHLNRLPNARHSRSCPRTLEQNRHRQGIA